MPGANCSVYGCTTSRYSKGVAIFSVPRGEDEFNSNWRTKLEYVVTKDRVITKELREQISKRKIRVCELHFKEDDLNRRK